MRNTIITIAVLFSSFASVAVKAEDVIDLGNKAKTGETKVYITSEMLADGTVWEMETTCTKVSKNSVICVTEDDLGLVESKQCRGNKCKVLASR
jgi:hypothetical protein